MNTVHIKTKSTGLDMNEGKRPWMALYMRRFPRTPIWAAIVAALGAASAIAFYWGLRRYEQSGLADHAIDFMEWNAADEPDDRRGRAARQRVQCCFFDEDSTPGFGV